MAASTAAASTSSCEIARIPEDLLAASIARTAPRDACRAAAVSPAFRTAADSDAVWSCFLPRDLPPLDDEVLPLGFSEGAELRDVCWLEIRGKIHRKMLSQKSTYAAYMVFKILDKSYGLDYPPQEAAVVIRESKLTRLVCLQGHENEGEGEEEVPQNYRPLMVPAIRRRLRTRNLRLPRGVHVPKKRADGWLEMEMGEFTNEEGEDGEVSISLMETRGGNWKKGLIVQGIEIRARWEGGMSVFAHQSK